MKAEKKYYVYTLAKPDGTVFYVGKGTGDRINAHAKNAKNGVQSYTCNTIRKIWNSECKVIQTKVAFFEDEFEAYAFERHLITFFGGRENLTNLTDGGEGGSGRPRQEIHQQATTISLSQDTLDFIDWCKSDFESRSKFIEAWLKSYPLYEQWKQNSH